MRREAGVTFVELLAGLLLVAVIGALAVPGLAALRRGAAMSAAVQEMVAALALARSVALARGLPVAVCLSADGEGCLTGSGQVANRWVVFVNRNGDQPARRGTDEPLLHVYSVAPPVRLHATRAGVNYWPTPRAGSTTTFTFCEPRRAAEARAVIVSQTGRVRVARRAAEVNAAC